MQNPNRRQNPSYWRKRTQSGPTTGQFGPSEFVDARGREYARMPDQTDDTATPTELACRVVRKRKRGRRSVGEPRHRYPLSRTGGQWNPRWPRPGQRLTLLRRADMVLHYGMVKKVFYMPVGVTARIVFRRPLVAANTPVPNPAAYRAWFAPTGTAASAQESRRASDRRRASFPRAAPSSF